ncbi:MAG: hypothetical protein KKB37_09065 [Alphaproteobacteria bacterium]|nr:hypothetical protein [Alphaproteobacteria bacterium]
MLLISRNTGAKPQRAGRISLSNTLNTLFAGKRSSATSNLRELYDMSKYLVIAVITAAVAVSACRRELPHPNGLGAKDIAATQKIVK